MQLQDIISCKRDEKRSSSTCSTLPEPPTSAKGSAQWRCASGSNHSHDLEILETKMKRHEKS